MEQETYNLWSFIISSLGVVAAGFAAVVYYGQLKKMAESARISREQLESMARSVEEAVKANSLATLSAVLTLESAIAENRARLSAAAAEVGRLKADDDEQKRKTAALVFNEARENYLNSMDRLCACILRGQFPEEEYRKDYRNWVFEIMSHDNYKDLIHRMDTRYRNIVKLYERWQDQ